MRNSIGLIEVEGLVGAIVGMEAAKGSGMITVKIEGEVGAVKAGVEAGAMAASRVAKIISKHVIARPNIDTYKLIDTYVEKEETKETEIKEEVKEESKETEVVEELKELEEINKNNKNNKKNKNKKVLLKLRML